jgi:hypothetical protein
MEKNRCLDPDVHATSIRAIPILLGVRKETHVIKMASMPDIPDQAMSFEEMGALMDAYDGDQHEQYNPASPRKPPREAKHWARLEQRAHEDYRQAENEYEILVKELEQDLAKK